MSRRALPRRPPSACDGPPEEASTFRLEGEHGKTHATLIRARFVEEDTVGAQQPPVTVLHQVAAQIVRCCGVSPLKAHRWAWGWTLDQAIRAFHDMCVAQELGRHALTSRSWQMWEAGRTTSDRYRDLLCRLFQTSGVALGFTPDYTPRPSDVAMVDSATAAVPALTLDLTWRSSVDDRLSDLDAGLAAAQAAIAALHACMNAHELPG